MWVVGGREQVGDGWVEADWIGVGVLFKSVGGISDGGGHGNNKVGCCSVSREEKAEAAVVDWEVADAFGMVWECGDM